MLEMLQNEGPWFSSTKQAFYTRSSMEKTAAPLLFSIGGPETMRGRVRERRGPSLPTTFQQFPLLILDIGEQLSKSWQHIGGY